MEDQNGTRLQEQPNFNPTTFCTLSFSLTCLYAFDGKISCFVSQRKVEGNEVNAQDGAAMRPISSNSSWGSMTSGTSTIGNLGMLLVHEPNDLPTRFSAITSLQEIASEALITTDTVRAVKALAAGLYSQPSLVRRKCIEALGQSRYHSVVPELRGILRNQNFSENIGDRLRAAKGLGMLRREVIDEVMIDLLSVRYDEDEVAVVRDAAEVAAAKLSLAIRAEEVLSDV